MKSIDSLIREADEIFEKRASAKPQNHAAEPGNDEEVIKLANFLAQDGDGEMEVNVKLASAQTEETPFEKVAHAIALVETMINIEQLQKLSDFEKTAQAKGYSEAQIDEFMEKQALKPVHKLLTAAGLLGLAGGVTEAHGRKKGYNKALEDVSRAFSAQEPSVE